MTKNIFFDRSQLKKCGENVIIGKTVRIRYPDLVEIGDNVIIDDFTYISTALQINSYAHISAGCKLIGGKEAIVRMGKFSTLAPNVVLAAGSDDYLGGMATPLVGRKFKAGVSIGEINLGCHCIIGANSTILPNVQVGEGACLGAQSLAKANLSAWGLYAGCPARKIKERDKEGILKLEEEFWKEVANGK